MIVISDTTPLRYLIETDLAHILEALFGNVIIPQAVFAELQHAKTPLKVKNWIVSHPAWLEVRQADHARRQAEAHPCRRAERDGLRRRPLPAGDVSRVLGREQRLSEAERWPAGV